MTTERPANIYDVARTAAVSVATVSNVLNHPEKVAPATRLRIESAIAALGFVPSGVARSLAVGSSATLGFVVDDLASDLFLDMIRGAQSAARAAGLTLLVADAGAGGEQQSVNVRAFREARVAGILLASHDVSDGAARELSESRVPAVLLNAQAAGLDLCAALPDDTLGGYLAARHLIDLGRRRLLWAGPTRTAPMRDRLTGVQRAIRESGDRATLTVIDTPDARGDDGRAVAALVEEMPHGASPDGVIAGTDLLAVGFGQMISARGRLSLPEEIGLVGYGNMRGASHSPIPITTLDQGGLELGRAATEMLLDELGAGRRSRGAHQHRVLRVRPSLVPRASTVTCATMAAPV